jgi:hypothetical protein
MDPPALSALPTLATTVLPDNINVKDIANDWFTHFTAYIDANDIASIITILSDRPFWRDILALTWDFRTFDGPTQITQFLTDRWTNSTALMTALKLDESSVQLQMPFPDVAWIQASFGFETAVGSCSGLFRLVPTLTGKSVDWKAHCIFTNLEDLKGFPEKIGALRAHEQNSAWAEQRRLEALFADDDPAVLICGAGQSGLELAARLKNLGVSTLVIEKNARIGDNWRNRYQSLSLHDPVCEPRHVPFRCSPFFDVFVRAFTYALHPVRGTVVSFSQLHLS